MICNVLICQSAQVNRQVAKSIIASDFEGRSLPDVDLIMPWMALRAEQIKLVILTWHLNKLHIHMQPRLGTTKQAQTGH
jgi:hypothetical protein